MYFTTIDQITEREKKMQSLTGIASKEQSILVQMKVTNNSLVKSLKYD